MSYPVTYHRSTRNVLASFLLFAGVGLTIGLYSVKIRAQAAQSEAERLEKLVQEEEAVLNVLMAELAYLESPDRVGEMAREKLNLEPIGSRQVIDLHDLDRQVPLVHAPQDHGVEGGTVSPPSGQGRQ